MPPCTQSANVILLGPWAFRCLHPRGPEPHENDSSGREAIDDRGPRITVEKWKNIPILIAMPRGTGVS
jgi:hypothetical protein